MEVMGNRSVLTIAKDVLRPVKRTVMAPINLVRTYAAAGFIAVSQGRERSAEIGGCIDADHHRIVTAPRSKQGLINLGIDGYLWPEEAAKLYELAYTAPGDVLELGTYRGLSVIEWRTNRLNRLKK